MFVASALRICGCDELGVKKEMVDDRNVACPAFVILLMVIDF
jgi:hypothetical protein